MGDNAWHLYNIQSDPGETEDLKSLESERFKDLQQDYENYAHAFGVLPI